MFVIWSTKTGTQLLFLVSAHLWEEFILGGDMIPQSPSLHQLEYY